MQSRDFNTLTVNQLIESIKANDTEVLQFLYTSNFPKVETLVLKNSGDHDQAKDLFQEAFIAFWNNIKQDKFSPNNQASLNGYLYTIAKNKWTDYLRSNRYKKTVSTNNDWVFEKPEDETTALDDKLENDRLLNKTITAFKHLGQPCKELLTKFYFEKKSMKDIADELELDSASTRNKKYRCMQQLRDIALKSLN